MSRPIFSITGASTSGGGTTPSGWYIVPAGTDIGTLDHAYVPPAIQQTELRRRPLSERSAA